jgi:hypothetical protein
VVIGLDATCLLAPRAGLLSRRQLRRQSRHDLPRDAVLQREEIFEFPVIVLGPLVIPGGGIDELGRDSHTITGLANATL